jgi:RimJ/RimL family protein N-acetyltransferase
MFELETERLVIRPWRHDDRAAFAVIAHDAEVMRYVNGGVPLSEPEIDEFLTRQARHISVHSFCMGAVVEKSSGRIIGAAGPQPLGTTGELEIGWWLARDVWGRGFATEAGRAAMNHVLETLQRPRVLAIIDAGNEPSTRVVQRLGMRYEGRKTGKDIGDRKPDIIVDVFVRERSVSSG